MIKNQTHFGKKKLIQKKKQTRFGKKSIKKKSISIPKKDRFFDFFEIRFGFYRIKVHPKKPKNLFIYFFGTEKSIFFSKSNRTEI